MRQAIETTYLKPEHDKGARIMARAQAGKISVSWDHALNVDENHDVAAIMLAQKLNWKGSWLGAARVNGKGNVYVPMETKRTAPTFTVKGGKK